MNFIIIGLMVLFLSLTIYAQFLVMGRFNKYAEVEAKCGLTGADVARKLLDQNGCLEVNIEVVEGKLSDHYDPVADVVRLSEDVYYGSNISAMSVAAHEVGHVIQKRQSNPFLVFRHYLVPIVNITSNFMPFLILGGVLFKITGLLMVGIIFFSFAVLFQLITLPVEFDASAKARKLMVENDWISTDEEKGVKKVLGAAALTYVAAALYSVTELAHLVIMLLSGEED